jgi:hypothetical protein
MLNAERFKGNAWRYFFITTGFFVLLLVVYGILYAFEVVSVFPNAETLMRWDANFYRSIRDQGYIYLAEKNCNSGFFPLFPYLWKLSHLGTIGIVLLNVALFVAGTVLLCKRIEASPQILLVFLSLPFMFFMFTPLSESLFFFLAVLLLIGISKNSTGLIFTAVFLAALTRPSAAFFVPAGIITFLFTSTPPELSKTRNWLQLCFRFVVPVFLGFTIVCLVQYFQTGHFLGYFETQTTAWGRSLGMPQFPIGRTSTPLVVLLSRVNFWLGTFILLWVLKLAWNKLRSAKNVEPANATEIFSTVFLLFSFFSVLFFNPEWFWWDEWTGTSINGINRYLQANPFILVFLAMLYRNKTKTLLRIILLFLVSNLLWFGLDPNYLKHISRTLPMLAVAGVLLPYWLYHYKRNNVLLVWILIVSVFMQCQMFNHYMNWILVD